MSYSPVLGRFIQRDPLGYVDGANLHQYVRSAPVCFVDPGGLVEPGAGGGMVFGRIIWWLTGPRSIGGQYLDIAWTIGPHDALDAIGHGLNGTTADRAFVWGDMMEAKYKGKFPGCFTADELSNAFRHVYWQAMLTMLHGAPAAATVGAIHEGDDDSDDSHADRRNNIVGQRIGLRASSEEDVRFMIEAAFLRGELWGRGEPGRPGIYLLDPNKCPKVRPCPVSPGGPPSTSSSSS